MGYVVTDGVSRHEFETLREALEFRRDTPLPIFRSDSLGNLKRIPLSELSSAVQTRDYGHPTPVQQQETGGQHSGMIAVLVMGVLMFLIAAVLVWFIFSGAF